MKKIAILFTLFLFCAACEKAFSPSDLSGTLWKTYHGTSGILFTSKTECELCYYSGNIVTSKVQYKYVCKSSGITLTPLDKERYDTLAGDFIDDELHITMTSIVGTTIKVFFKQ